MSCFISVIFLILGVACKNDIYFVVSGFFAIGAEINFLTDKITKSLTDKMKIGE